MKKPMRWLISGLVALTLIPLSLAVSAATPAAACPGAEVNGTVVAVDAATGQVTLDTGGGVLCTVTLPTGEDGHPIATLLGRYFDQANVADLLEALETTSVWVLCPPAGDCALAEADTAGAVPGQVTAVTANADGSFTLTVQPTGGGPALLVPTLDADLAEALPAALAALAVQWELEAGDAGVVVADATDEIAALHQDGLGFGVIVKLYAMAEASEAACEAEGAPDPCGVTVTELVEQFRSGVGLGQLFKLYGKPALLGVGHVRRAGPPAASATPTPLAGDADDEAADEPSSDHPGCVNGGAGANSHNPHCTGTAPGGPGNGGGNNGNGNNGNGHGKP